MKCKIQSCKGGETPCCDCSGHSTCNKDKNILDSTTQFWKDETIYYASMNTPKKDISNLSNEYLLNKYYKTRADFEAYEVSTDRELLPLLKKELMRRLDNAWKYDGLNK